MSCYKYDKDGNLVDFFSEKRVPKAEAESIILAIKKGQDVAENEYFFIVEESDMVPAGLLNVGGTISCAR